MEIGRELPTRCNNVTPPCLPSTLPLWQLDDYYYECESMHGLEKTKVVAQSLRGAADWIENVCREVRRAMNGTRCVKHVRLLAAAAGWLLHGCAGGAASQARRAQAPQAGARRPPRGQAFNQGPTSC